MHEKVKKGLGWCAAGLLAAMLAGCGSGTGKEVPEVSTGQTENQSEQADTDLTEHTESIENVKNTENTEEKEKSESSKTEKPKPATEGALLPVPPLYLLQIKNAGKVEKVEYETDAYGETIQKYAYVYLPYGYDETKQYDVLYCLHGGGGEIDAYFNTSAKKPKTQLLFDSMIENGDVDPFIAVSPTYYGGKGDASKLVEIFCEDELPNDLIPAVEGKYSSYAKSTDLEGLKASRDHRAYSGFSMGALSTWYAFVKSVDYFRYYIPISGDCWINGSGNANGAAVLLEKVCTDKGYGEDDFFIYAVTGDKDIAYSAMKAQMSSMKLSSPSFHFVTEDDPKGNISFRAEPGAKHDYFYMPLYYYNALPTFWRGEPVYREE